MLFDPANLDGKGVQEDLESIEKRVHELLTVFLLDKCEIEAFLCLGSVLDKLFLRRGASREAFRLARDVATEIYTHPVIKWYS